MARFTFKTFKTNHTEPTKAVKCEVFDDTGKLVSAGHGTDEAAAKKRAFDKLPEDSEFVEVKPDKKK